MRASDRALTVCDRPNVLHITDFGSWVRRWWHYGGWGMYVLRWAGSEVDSPFIRTYEKIEYGKDL